MSGLKALVNKACQCGSALLNVSMWLGASQRGSSSALVNKAQGTCQPGLVTPMLVGVNPFPNLIIFKMIRICDASLTPL